MRTHAEAGSRFARALVVASLLSFASFGCSHPRVTQDAPPASSSATNIALPDEQRDRIYVTTVTETSFKRTVATTGTVAFDQNRSTHVVSAISGTIVDLLVPLGAHVTAGTPLARVASSDFAADVSAFRKSSVVSANLRRIAEADKKLLENGNIGRREMEQAQADAISADADLAAAADQLRALGVPTGEMTGVVGKDGGTLGVIRATMEGTVVENLANPGELLQAGSTAVFTIAQLNDMWVMANVFETDLPLVKAGDSADVMPAMGATPLAGRVDYVGDLVDPTTRAVAVRIVVDNKSHLLKQGAYVNVTTHSSDETRGILIPASALLLDSESMSFVFVSNADHTFSRRHVTTGSRVGDQVEIKDGLKGGEDIVTDGGLFIQFAQDQ